MARQRRARRHDAPPRTALQRFFLSIFNAPRRVSAHGVATLLSSAQLNATILLSIFSAAYRALPQGMAVQVVATLRIATILRTFVHEALRHSAKCRDAPRL